MAKSYHIVGALTFSEYLECHKILAAKRRLWLRGIITIYGAGMLTYWFFFTQPKSDIIFAIIGAILIAYGIVISPIQFRYRVKRNWDRYPKIKKEFSIVFSNDGVETIDDRGNPSHSAWDNFLRIHESESLFMLYLSPLLPQCVPKRLVPEEDLDGLRRLLSSKIGNQI